jgi:PAS domain S-box-containing protein
MQMPSEPAKPSPPQNGTASQQANAGLRGRVDPELSSADLRQRVLEELPLLRQEAQRATSLLSAIVDSSDDAIVSKNLDGTITSWNKSAEGLFGYAAREAIGRNINLIIPQDRREEERAIIEQIKRGERVDHFETVRLRKDGSKVDISVTISPLKDAEGQVIGASKVARDITERKRVEQERQTFVTLADRCTEFIGMCDMEFRPFYVNDAALRLVGLDSLAELRSTRVGDFFFPEDQAFITNEFLPRVLHEGSGEVEIRFRHFKSGTTIWMIYNVFVIRDSTGTAIALGTFSQNITERKEAEDALRRSEERLRTLSERLDSEVRIRTRELEQRNAEVLAGTQRLRDLTRRMMQMQDDERRRIARELHDSAGQLLAALDMKLVQLAQAVRPELTRDATEAEQLVQQLSQEIRTTSYLLHPPLLDEIGLPAALSWYVRGLVERSHLDIRLSISDDLGRLAPDLELVIFRLVQECLTNVHRHSGSKSAMINIKQQAESVCLEVQDQGKGIAPGKLAEIQSQASGVGIRGMRERVRQFDGELNIESNESGTMVTVTLPIRRATHPSSQSETLRSLEDAS